MPKKKSTTTKHVDVVRVVTHVGAGKVVTRIDRGGREVWRVSSRNGQTKELTTSGSSEKTMDEAVTIYGRALQRLADR